MKTLIAGSNGMAGVAPARGGGVRDWQRWAPYAAVTWSLIYAALGIYWAVSGGGFPYAGETVFDVTRPVVGRFGPGVAWIAGMMAGIPAAAVGAAMLSGVRSRALRPFLITAGALLAAVLLLLMTSLDLLIKLGDLPYAVLSLFTGAKFGQPYLKSLTQWATAHQLLCLIGGFLWLAATSAMPAGAGAPAVLWPPRRPGGVAETEPSRALGLHRRLCGDGGASLLRPHPLRLGAGVPAGYERGVPASRSRERHVDRGTLPGDLRPGGSGTHARIGAALG